MPGMYASPYIFSNAAALMMSLVLMPSGRILSKTGWLIQSHARCNIPCLAISALCAWSASSRRFIASAIAFGGAGFGFVGVETGAPVSHGSSLADGAGAGTAEAGATDAGACAGAVGVTAGVAAGVVLESQGSV